MDWKTKNAKLDLDEAAVPAQAVATAMEKTPHMMGADLRYGGWLALSVPELTDEATAKKATEALSKLKGVAKVAPYVKHRAIGVQFVADGKLTSKELIDTLAKAGLKAANY